MRWDIEEDLARVIGDAPAHALASAAETLPRRCAVRTWSPAPTSGQGARMSRLFRGAFIVWVVLRYGLDELVLTAFRHWLRVVARIVSVGRNLEAPRGQRMREALERLGPIFVKFGQVLSTRRDLLPQDIADELALPARPCAALFSPDVAIAIIERAFKPPGGRDLQQL
jgi:hypothetical protein